MKLALIILAAFTASIAALHAADTITVVSPSLVQKNGVNVGNVASFVATNPQFASDVQAGLEKWAADLQSASSAAVQDASVQQAAAEAKLKQLVEGAKSALAENTSEKRMAAAAKLLEAVEQTEAEKRLAEIETKLAELQAEKAKLAD